MNAKKFKSFQYIAKYVARAYKCSIDDQMIWNIIYVRMAGAIERVKGTSQYHLWAIPDDQFREQLIRVCSTRSAREQFKQDAEKLSNSPKFFGKGCRFTEHTQANGQALR